MTPEYSEFADLLKRGKALDAVRFAEYELLARDNEDVFWLTQLAVALVHARKYKDALSIAERVLLLKPQNAYGLLAAADALRGMGKIEDALSYYREAATTERVHRRAMRGVFDCFGQLKQWMKIVELVEQNPSLKTLALRRYIEALTHLDRTDEAISICKESLKKTPDNPNALWLLVDLEIKSEGLNAVLKRIEKVARIPSRPPIYKEIYASLCRRAGKQGKAAKQYQKMASGHPSEKTEAKKAFALAKSGRENEAIPLLEDLMRHDPVNVYLHSSYVAACRRVKELSRAKKFYEELLTLHPEEKSIYGRIRRVEKQIEA